MDERRTDDIVEQIAEGNKNSGGEERTPEGGDERTGEGSHIDHPAL